MGRLYKNPPLAEVICQFRFEPSQPWDWTVAGRMYNAVESTYPKRQQVTGNTDEAEDESTPEDSTRLHFLREDESTYISISQDFMAIHCVGSYTGWEDFEVDIANALQAYSKVAAPHGLRHVALRYINVLHVDTSGPHLVLGDYLTVSPGLPRNIFGAAERKIFRNWVQRIDLVLDQINGVLSVQTGTLEEVEHKRPALLLDLECYASAPQEIALPETAEWLQASHNAIEQMFEACVTQKARDIFGGTTEEAHHEDSSA